MSAHAPARFVGLIQRGRRRRKDAGAVLVKGGAPFPKAQGRGGFGWFGLVVGRKVALKYSLPCKLHLVVFQNRGLRMFSRLLDLRNLRVVFCVLRHCGVSKKPQKNFDQTKNQNQQKQKTRNTILRKSFYWIKRPHQKTIQFKRRRGGWLQGEPISSHANSRDPAALIYPAAPISFSR